jgi:hypothetical protein
MLIKLHSQATTTSKIRAAIQASDKPAWGLAQRHGTTNRTFGNGARVTALRIAAIRRIGFKPH